MSWGDRPGEPRGQCDALSRPSAPEKQAAPIPWLPQGLGGHWEDGLPQRNNLGDRPQVRSAGGPRTLDPAHAQLLPYQFVPALFRRLYTQGPHPLTRATRRKGFLELDWGKVM